MQPAAPAPAPAAALRPAVHFRCRRCRAVLCRGDQLEDPPHEEGRHAFSHHRRRKEGLQAAAAGGGGGASDAAAAAPATAAAAQPACTSIFLAEALQWMRAASLDPVEGKLLCFGCGARVGALRWAGSQCSCGTWVCPAVQLYRSCLDDIVQQPFAQQLAPAAESNTNPAAAAAEAAAAAAAAAEPAASAPA